MPRREPKPTTSLELAATMTAAPADLRPMMPTDGRWPRRGDDLYDLWWGGGHVVAYLGDDTCRLLGEDGADATADHLALAERLRVLDVPRPLVVDGEIVGEWPVRGERQATAAQPTLVAVDLLWHEGRSLLARPIEARRDALLAVAPAGADGLVCLPALSGDAAALLRLATDHGLPGLVGKRAHSPYLPGVRSRLWHVLPTGAGTSATAEEEGRSSPILAVLDRLPL
jgi:bifunctional non-homologous end joining protein LigD